MTTDQILAALGDPIRLVLCELMVMHEGELCVATLVERVNERLGRTVTQPTISHHLRILRHAGLVTAIPDGLNKYYCFEHATFEQALRTVHMRLSTVAEVA